MTLEDRILKDKISILVNYYKIKDFDKLIEEADRILKKNPNLDLLWNILGLTYQQLKDYEKAEEKFTRCLQVNPKNLSAINNLGNNYKYLYNFDKAQEFFERVLDQNPNYLTALVNFGNLKYELNKFDDALKFLNRALKVNNKVVSIHLNLSLVYQSLGNFIMAISHLKIINDLQPNFTRADKLLSSLLDYKSENEHFTLMQNKLGNLKLDDSQKIQLYFAISKAYEDRKEFSNAFIFFEKGNKLKREQSTYSINKDKSLFNTLKINNNNFSQSNKKIVFIVGMPRSGTTLVEQIISSHNNVFGAGELTYLGKLIDKNFFENGNIKSINDIEKIHNFEFSKISNNYLDYLKCFDSNEDYITDKTLLNFQWIGFIKILFPNCTIINCLRDPKDNCLSIYKNLFEHEGPWCYDKKELSEFYKLYEDLMYFWSLKFPNTVHNIKYEDLVKNPEVQIKSLINNINIGWDEKCLKFYENKTAVKTLSVNQARKKIYTSSVSLHENYKDFLQELFKYFE